MNAAKLIKSKVIPFTKTLIDNYKAIGLSEVDTILLCKLYLLYEEGTTILSVESLEDQMNLSSIELSKHVLDLVERGYLSIEITGGAESFNLDGTIEKLATVIEFDESQDTTLERQQNLTTVVEYLEKMANRIATPVDLKTINRWLDEKRDVDTLKRAILEACKLKKFNISYMDAIVCSKKTREKDVIEVDEDLKELLNNVYKN